MLIEHQMRLLSKELPFQNLTPFSLSQYFLSVKDKLFERLESNNFTKNCIKLVNGFSKDNYTCSYYDELSLDNLYKGHMSDALKIFHLNIASFNKNGVALKSYLSSLTINFDIICLTEIGKANIGLIDKEFPNYHIYIDNSPTAKGGVAVLIHNSKFHSINEIDINPNFNLKNKCPEPNCNKCQIENKWISIKVNNQEIIIGAIYRHPGGVIDHFNCAMNNTLKLLKNSAISFIIGDININLMDEHDTKTETYLNQLFENNFIPCVNLPSRISHHSATLIDHIFAKIPPRHIQNKCSSGNLITDISDHLPNFTIFNIKMPSIQNRPYVRTFSKENIDLFTNNLQTESELISDFHLYDANVAYDVFSNNYIELLNKYFPYKRISRQKFKDKPYITSGIKVSIREKNKLYHKYLKNRSDVNEAAWKAYRNKVNTCIKIAETNYYRTILNDKNNNNANIWKTFGKIINKNKIKNKKCSILNIDDQDITDEIGITRAYNKHFSEIANRLGAKFSNINNNEFQKFLGDPASQSIYLHSTNEREIKDTIKNLKNTNSAGHDEFSSKFIKLSEPLLNSALVKIFNLALKTGTYPDRLKIAKVIPIFKKGSPTSVNNYRPISILSSINKIFEKILYARLIKYIDKFQLLYKYQYGFRKNHSTEHALIEFVDQVRFSMDKKELTCGIFIDLSKAFDTVNHNILIKKLEHYGIRGLALDLFKSYLINRKQYVQIEACKSETFPIECGVPQGSVLGPLLFLLFINDLPNCSTLGKFRIFADDTTVFFHCYNDQELISTGKTIMIELNSWFRSNKMTLNADKSSFTIFKSNRLYVPNLPDQIEFLDMKINKSSSIKFLGLTLDENLSWDQHINELSNKLKSLFHIFYNIRDFLNEKDIKMLYFTLVFSRIKYGIALYGQAAQTKVKKIQVLQNQLLKVLSKKDSDYPTEKLHKEFKILMVQDIKNHEILTFVHNYFNDNLPPVFDDYFNNFNHCYNTRNRNTSFQIRDHNTDLAALSVQIDGSKQWNNLNNDLKLIPKRKLFRKELKEYLMKEYSTV